MWQHQLHPLTPNVPHVYHSLSLAGQASKPVASGNHQLISEACQQDTTYKSSVRVDGQRKGGGRSACAWTRVTSIRLDGRRKQPTWKRRRQSTGRRRRGPAQERNITMASRPPLLSSSAGSLLPEEGGGCSLQVRCWMSALTCDKLVSIDRVTAHVVKATAGWRSATGGEEASARVSTPTCR